MTNREIRKEINKAINSRGTLFEKELRIEKDLFGRFRLTAVDTPESMMIQGVLFLLMFLLGFFYCITFIPAKILISRPDKVSFWTYFFWLFCFGLLSLGLFSDGRPGGLVFNLSAVPYNISLIQNDYGVWGIVVFAAIFLVNLLAFISRVAKSFTLSD